MCNASLALCAHPSGLKGLADAHGVLFCLQQIREVYHFPYKETKIKKNND